jgi:hypothetical protein
MHAHWPTPSAAVRWSGQAGRPALATVAVILVAGCSSAAKSTQDVRPAAGGQTSTTVSQCGSTRTAANVPVNVEVEHGKVSCTLAMTVERHYAKAIQEGRAPGNGGGGPVTIDGWRCQGFPTPEVLKTGQASECVSGATKILAILPAPA